MKTNIIIKTALTAACSFLLLSCDKFLSELPDNRTEVDTPSKIQDIIVSAYPDVAPYGLLELMSDNVIDTGREYDEGYETMRGSYRYRKIESTHYDSPHWIWESTYKSIGAANVALEEAAKYEDYDLVKAQIGEAYLCRAFSHFLLCNLFCQAYNPVTSDADLGIPYVTEPENTVFVDYDRGTVAGVYEKIAADIEAGFPLLDDSKYKVPLYHFTRRAAAAFAAQFYLYYGKYDQVVKYATIVLGDNPRAVFRNWDLVTGTNTNEISDKFIAATEAANVFLHGFQSLYIRYRTARYVYTDAKSLEASGSAGPWNGKLEPYDRTWFFGGYRHLAMSKIREYFLVTDPVAYVGEPFVVKTVGCTEKALIDRAEAYTMLGEYEKAGQDLRYFYESARDTKNPSTDDIIKFYRDDVQYSTDDDPTVKKRLDNSRFPIENDGKMEYLLHACLHARRIVTLEEGDRTMDLKRYGIAHTHILDGEDDIKIAPYDPRYAVQIPDMAIKAGVVPNPR